MNARDATRARRLVAAAVALLAVLLPALVAGRTIDRPAAAGELARLGAAVDDPDGRAAGPAQLLYVAFVDVAPLAGTVGTQRDAALRRALPMARLGMVAGLFVATALFHVAVTLAAGRALAWLACLVLAVVAPVRDVGCSLRPEVANLAFAMLGLVAVVALCRPRAGTAAGRAATTVATLAGGLALGLAVATQPAYGVHLFAPGLGAAWVLAANLRGTWRALRQRRPDLAPVGGAWRELVPWLLTTLCSFAAGAVLLRSGAPAPTPTGVGLVPTGWWVPVAALAGAGAVVWVLGSRSRPPAQRMAHALLAAQSALWIGHRAMLAPDADALPAAPAFALFVAAGLTLAVVLPGRRRVRI
ncbi:MAG: hypothetical protein IPM29_20030 [Planctomycetes bacterium]|nr:hypothetical protein [Planctomycetota bacterium]